MTTRLAARSPSSPNAPPEKAKPQPTSASTTPARPRPPTRKNSYGSSALLATGDRPPQGFERYDQSTLIPPTPVLCSVAPSVTTHYTGRPPPGRYGNRYEGIVDSYPNMASGKYEETIQFGWSTISEIFRSTTRLASTTYGLDGLEPVGRAYMHDHRLERVFRGLHQVLVNAHGGVPARLLDQRR